MSSLLLASIDTEKLLIILALVAVISIVFAVFIVLVSKLCAVPVNEKEEKIHENLAGANCGGCGYAGCADFAKALSEGKADISSCGPTPPENKAIIAEILGKPFAPVERKVATVHCMGGYDCTPKFNYIGNTDCHLQANFDGGNKTCLEGCLGGGSCVSVCKYDALHINDKQVAEIDNSLCEACGLCVKTCPKHVIDFVPYTAKIYIACSSHCKGKDVMNACKVGCIGCGICAKTCPNGAITMENNLPIIDYSKCTGCKACVARCPRKCIKEYAI